MTPSALSNELLPAAEAASSWLERWAKHVGNCAGGNACTCGLTAVRAEIDTALTELLSYRSEGEQALQLLGAEDARQDKIQDLLETVREQIRLEVAPEHRPEGLMTNIQSAVYAMRGRTRLMNDAAITSALSPSTERAETIEGCIRAIEAARSKPINSASVEYVDGVSSGHSRSIAAIRALNPSGSGERG